jgi:integrase
LADTPINDLEKPWQKVRQLAKLEDVRLHDLRHTFASIAAGAGLSLPLIGNLLGHTQAATTARYTHIAANPARDAVERIGSAMEALLELSTEIRSKAA